MSPDNLDDNLDSESERSGTLESTEQVPSIFFDRPPEVRRIERMAVAYLALAATAMWILTDANQAIVLTLIGSLSIVNFRALQLQVSLLEPRSDGRLGARNTLLLVLRLTFLGALVSGALLLGRNFILALVLGFSVIPAALMTEGVVRVAGFLRKANHGS
jgi:hypothetical protein